MDIIIDVEDRLYKIWMKFFVWHIIKKVLLLIIAIAINVSKNIKRLGVPYLVFSFANYQNILQKYYNTIKLKLQ